MNKREVREILRETAYVREGGTEAERRCATYLFDRCRALGATVTVEDFSVPAYSDVIASLTVDGVSVPVKPMHGLCGEASAPLYYLESTNQTALKRCRGKIVLTERAVGKRLYEDLVGHGACGILSSYGNVASSAFSPDVRERRFSVDPDTAIPCGIIYIGDALRLVKKGGVGHLFLKETRKEALSHNVIADLEGESEEMIVLSAHYDSTPNSVGAYDNLSGCIALLYLAEYFQTHPHRRRIRLLFCGSEERGLLGSLAYCRMHRGEKTVLNVNLDMLGSAMGGFVCFSSANEEMARYLETFAKRHRFPTEVRHAIRSSDSNSFVHFGIPALSLARYAPAEIGKIHTALDTEEMLSEERLLSDAHFAAILTEALSNDPTLVSIASVSEEIGAEVERYFYANIYAKKEK